MFLHHNLSRSRLPLRSAELVAPVHVLTLPFRCNFIGRQIQFPSGSMTLILQANCRLLENWIHQCSLLVKQTGFKGQVEIRGGHQGPAFTGWFNCQSDVFHLQYLSMPAKKWLKLISFIALDYSLCWHFFLNTPTAMLFLIQIALLCQRMLCK